MKIKFFPTFLIILFLIIFFIFYKGLQNTNIYTPNIGIEKNIPNFDAKNFDNGKIVNSDQIFEDDEFYVMNIWSSWCIPCREEHDFLINLSNQSNIKIIGLNYKDKKENAKKFLQEFSSPYRIILSDTEGLIAIEWGAYGVPETFVIYDKKIIKKFIGPLNSNLTLEIKRLAE